MATILVCDDEKDIVSALSIYLSGEGYEVVSAYDGKEALKKLHEQRIDLVLLDIMMPVMDGIETMTRLREFSNVPVIFLTAKSEDMDKVLGLNLGADDYVTKPFHPVELIARVRSHLRRYQILGSAEKHPEHLMIGGLELFDRAKEVTLDGEPLSLTPTEYEILKLLMENAGRVFSPKEIYVRVWGDDPSGTENTVAVHIRHIREKIEYDPSEPRYLTVVWGQGYRMEKRGTNE